MKGVFTQIKYIAQGATLREATNTGMVVGLPIATEQRKQILASDDDITIGDGSTYPIIEIKGDNAAFDYQDGDILHDLRIWVRKSSETKEDAIECFVNLTDPVYVTDDYAHYGDGDEVLATFNPIKNKLLAGLTGTWNNSTGELTFSAEITDIEPGDTIVMGTCIGKIGISRIASSVTVSPVTWIWGTPTTAPSTAITDLYYDYIENQGNNRNTDYASSVLTSKENDIPYEGGTVTIDNITYTFVEDLLNAAYSVKIGTNGLATLQNLAAAINRSAGSGELYGRLTTIHPTVTAGVATMAEGDAVLTLTAKWPGSKGTKIQIALSDEANKFFFNDETLLGNEIDDLAPRGYVLYYDAIVYRTAQYGLSSISGLSDITDAYGDNAVTNPMSNLAMGAFLYMGASGMTNKFRTCAIDLRNVTDLQEQTPAELMEDMTIWTAALSHIDNIKDVYYLIPLTNNEAIHDIYEAYINTSATLYRQREKRLYLAKAIIDSGLDTNQAYFEAAFGNGAWGETDYEAGRLYTEGYDVDGTITYFDKDTDVEVAQARPMATNNERITYIGCEYATIDDINIDGYYIAAIIAGWRSGMALGYVADDKSVPLITSIPCGQNYYTEDDLSNLAKAGWYMLQQEMAGSPVTCYMQMTTAYDSTEKCEESFIVALDYCMRDIRTTLAPYTKGGLDNRVSGSNPESPVTVRYLNKLNAALATVRYKYMVQNEVFATLDVIAVRVSEMKKTAAEIDVRFRHYYPAREIYVTAYVE